VVGTTRLGPHTNIMEASAVHPPSSELDGAAPLPFLGFVDPDTKEGAANQNLHHMEPLDS